MDEHQNTQQDSGTANSAGTEAALKTLSPAAARALAEAEERRKAEQAQKPAPEVGGRGGADPARFGDWEINGRAIDF
ncbi:DUF1674 domain-containing protein [Agrobacterium vitis]|uniref:DUF1674 domain-containing protein n=1 Tax=Agrobacterium vitis TaxID=373 RepID=A0AAE5AWG7_AGRVI|nr:DUF1674 domain-containing protein [Agrobacterium vitis]MCF1498245.1 DUF1674 domain-containing protein [Allorhizobium sp. Av2]MCM2440369.1 DUF1674 domain-containing protein [Agrobacterium vitis]MUZ58165.1 DUF1674 domain-containing protein [Agrobacterium vitis]MVA66127.1 DUF1674 domain-containing protein [Agrobacterium vitis]MVA87045.1 DUF1674 domain-containing protein [Agrobacterium vitis]